MSNGHRFVTAIATMRVVTTIASDATTGVAIFLTLVFGLGAGVVGPPRVLFSSGVCTGGLQVVPFIQFRVVCFMEASDGSTIIFAGALPPSFFVLSESP